VASPRHRTPSTDVARAILDAAAELLEESGPSALSIRAIAERAQVAPMGVYNHFGDKSTVLDRLYQRGAQDFQAALAEKRDNPDPLIALRSVGQAYRRFSQEHSAEFSLLFLQPIPGFLPSPESHRAVLDAFQILVEAISRCQESGLLDSGSAIELARFIWASIHGFVLLERTSWSEVTGQPGDEGFEAFLDHLGQGFLVEVGSDGKYWPTSRSIGRQQQIGKGPP
jgi:AcrR family transcriptional regulator